MNTVPGLTRESILPQQAAAAGISMSDLFDNAIEEVLKQPQLSIPVFNKHLFLNTN